MDAAGTIRPSVLSTHLGERENYADDGDYD